MRWLIVDGIAMFARYSVREDELHLVSFLPEGSALGSALVFASDIVLVRR